jgi:MoxR-like ATPase
MRWLAHVFVANFFPDCRSFECPKSFRVFGAQNPFSQGGGRKGLPKSFLNRFTKVYVDPLCDDDLLTIANTMFPDLAAATWTVAESDAGPGTGAPLLKLMIDFSQALHADVERGRMGRAGTAARCVALVCTAANVWSIAYNKNLNNSTLHG